MLKGRREFVGILVAASAGALLRRGEPLVYGNSEAAPGRLWAEDPWAKLPQILKRITPPVFPKRDFVVTAFGADADGRADCTEVFRKAIDSCNRAGGGRVIVPAGSFVTGAIHLKSNVNLHLAAGATIKFSQDPRNYLPVVFTRWEGVELLNYSPFIYAMEQRNIAITGEGTIDGQADCAHWWPWKGRADCGWRRGDVDQSKARTLLLEMAEKGVPVTQRGFGEGHYLRPQLIQPYRCTNVLIEGVTLKNSPMWEIHPVLCTNVTVRRISIMSHGPNNDGCNPESCTDVLIKDCYFDTGDDCIAIKSGRNADGRRLNAPSQNIIVQGCQMKDGHGGITIGSEISGGVRNIFGENCRLDSPNLDHALRVKNNAARGGLLENLFFRDIEVGRVAHAVITIDFNYEEGEKGAYIPVVRNFYVKNLKSHGSRHAVDLQAFKHAPIINLQMEDCTFENVTRPSIVKNVTGMSVKNVKVNGELFKQPD